MLKLKEKVPVFLFGMTFGLFIGGIFFVFKLDDYFSKLKMPFQQQIKTEVVETPVNKSGDDDQKKSEVQKVKKSTNEDSNQDQSKESPSLAVYANFDSDSSSSSTESIKVLKEELISFKNLAVKNIDKTKLYKSEKDSMLAVMSGVTESKPSDFFLVEFRKTPLNSKGYKMSRNRLFIYGINESPDISIIKLNDSYYLKNNTIIYKLDYAVEFKPFEKTTDSMISEKFN